MHRSRVPAPAALLLLAVATTACSGLTSWSDYDPGRIDTVRGYQTWDWAYTSDGKVGDIRSYDRIIDDSILEKRIQSYIESDLQSKGLQRVEGGNPDFRVGYHLSINGKMDLSYINTYYGYGWGGYWGPYGPTMGLTYSTPTVREYQEGTLIVDVVDGGADELAWRGVVQGEVHEKRDAQERQQALNKAIKQAMKDFPPG
jgi:hypothetical protein